MDEEVEIDKIVENYLTDLTNLLNGQLRGAINLKAKETNKELIMMSLRDAFNQGKELGENITKEGQVLERLKQSLKDEEIKE